MQKEIIIGLTGGIGVRFDSVICQLRNELVSILVDCAHIKLSDLIKESISWNHDFNSELKRIKFLMDCGSELREKYDKKSFLAMLSILKIRKIRQEFSNKKRSKYFVYILDSLKRPEESQLLREIYGRNFLLLSVSSSEEERRENILKKIPVNMRNNQITDEINNLIEKDYQDDKSENLKKYGQNVVNTYPDAHFFIDTDNNLKENIERFVDILFGHPYHTPTIDERNMFFAKGVSLRSADLSRQVGAVISHSDGSVISMGCNEVPKFGGGFYEPTDKNDARDFKIGRDSNIEEKKSIIKDLLENLKKLGHLKPEATNLESLYLQLDKETSRITDLLEFGRSVHAELAAICDAAIRGISIKGGTLYCTTFPCHLCIKHILAAGIVRVVYIDPYPKSKALELYKGSLTTQRASKPEGKLLIDSFIGISPRRFLHVFKQEDRKNHDKCPKKIERTGVSPFLKTKFSLNYLNKEKIICEKINKLIDDENRKGILYLLNCDSIFELDDEAGEWWNEIAK